MGWASGSRLFSSIIESLKQEIEDEDVREAVYKALIPEFQEFDCDTLDECMGEDPAFDEALREVKPEWFDEDEEEDDDI